MNDPRTDALEEQARPEGLHPEGLHRETYADRVDDRADELASAAAAGDIEQTSLWQDAWRQLTALLMEKETVDGAAVHGCLQTKNVQ